jgi:hypothetical protein
MLFQLLLAFGDEAAAKSLDLKSKAGSSAARPLCGVRRD